MRSHIFIHHATTISFAKPFIFKAAIEKEGLPRGSPAGLGAGGPRFKSGRPDQNISSSFRSLAKQRFTQTTSVESKQAGVLPSHVGKLDPFRISRMSPDAGVQLQKTQQKRRNLKRGKV